MCKNGFIWIPYRTSLQKVDCFRRELRLNAYLCVNIQKFDLPNFSTESRYCQIVQEMLHLMDVQELIGKQNFVIFLSLYHP